MFSQITTVEGRKKHKGMPLPTSAPTPPHPLKSEPPPFPLDLRDLKIAVNETRRYLPNYHKVKFALALITGFLGYVQQFIWHVLRRTQQIPAEQIYFALGTTSDE